MSDLTAVSVPCFVSGATSCAGNSSSAFASGPEHGASRSPTSVAPALVNQNSQNELFRGFIAFMRSQELVSTAASSLVSVQSDSSTRLVYTSAPSDRPFSAVGTPPGPSPPPAPVRGSGSGRGGGMGAAGAPTRPYAAGGGGGGRGGSCPPRNFQSQKKTKLHSDLFSNSFIS